MEANFCFFSFSAILSACFFCPCPFVQPTRTRMTRKAPPRLHRPSLILQCHKDSHEVIVTIHLLSLNLSLISDRDNYCENGRSDWPGTADLVCQPVTLTKGKSLLWLVAPVAGLAAARPLYTWSEPVPAQSLSGAGGDNLSLARLSRYLLMPGTPVHGTEREGSGRWTTGHTHYWTGAWAFCTRGLISR